MPSACMSWPGSNPSLTLKRAKPAGGRAGGGAVRSDPAHRGGVLLHRRPERHARRCRACARRPPARSCCPAPVSATACHVACPIAAHIFAVGRRTSSTALPCNECGVTSILPSRSRGFSEHACLHRTVLQADIGAAAHSRRARARQQTLEAVGSYSAALGRPRRARAARRRRRHRRRAAGDRRSDQFLHVLGRRPGAGGHASLPRAHGRARPLGGRAGRQRHAGAARPQRRPRVRQGARGIAGAWRGLLRGGPPRWLWPLVRCGGARGYVRACVRPAFGCYVILSCPERWAAVGVADLSMRISAR